MRADEAIEVVDKYLDDAVLAGLETVTIIHGKGTGTLRATIGEFLKKHPRVKSQRLGGWNEGGSGVTVVEIKL
jgi:DNA mismatch repair protein MutS2